jgi:putative membrane protein
MPVEQSDPRDIATRIADIEARTGVRVTTVIVPRCDGSVELPWIAFALGASFAALACVVADVLAPRWAVTWQTLRDAVLILGVGAASALATIWIPSWARLFLRTSRRDVEVRQYAQAIFLTRELFDTPARTGLLMLVSRFERKIQFLADEGLRKHVASSDWRGVIARMTPSLRAGHPTRALHEGLAAVEELLVRKGMPASVPSDESGGSI